MDNTMNINLNSGNNSMDSLSFYWMAEFNNGVLFQFENGIEHKFQEVLDRINDLEYFHLYHRDGMTNINFIVDLKRGLIKTLDAQEPIKVEEKKNIRLIFFRRHKVEITEKMMEKSHTIEYHLGFQYNDKLGNNRQIILIIDEEGNWILEDN
jgi:uncharacterized FlaG/YvyC family protein